jgi:hypothetical protein
MSSIMLQCLKMVLMKNFQESQTRAQMTQFDKGQSYLVKSITRQVIQVSTDETLLISAFPTFQKTNFELCTSNFVNI